MRNLAPQEIPTLFLKPGEVHFAKDPQRVITVLGSCVSVTLFHKSTRTAAICHALLPQPYPDRCPIRPYADLKYVGDSLHWMLRQLQRAGIARAELEVKLFGGAEVLVPRIDSPRSPSVGRQNIEAALVTLKSLGMNPAVVDTGGTVGRKIHFYTHTGEVLLWRLGRGNCT